MATFKEHVEGLTGLTVGTTPTEDELSIFLQDGVREVVNRIVEMDPGEAELFTKTTDSGSNAYVVQTGKILSVLREHDNTNILRPCTKISPQLRYLATDKESLHYRSKYNPAFYIKDNAVFSAPAAAATDNNNIVVTQLYYDTGLAHGDTYPNIDNFPAKHAHLVGLYAAIKTVESNIAILTNLEGAEELTGIADASLGTALDYVQEEDSELAAASTQIAGAQIQKGNMYIQEEEQRLTTLRVLHANLVQEYYSGFPGQAAADRRKASAQLIEAKKQRKE